MPTLVHLAAYPNAHTGSFVPFLTAVLARAGERGWRIAAVLPPEAAGRDWIAGLTAIGAELYFVDQSRSGSTRWLRDRLQGGGEPTVFHTHFTRYDIAAAMAARTDDRAHAYWHVHTVLSESFRARAANRLKFSLLGPSLDGIFTPAADVAAELVRRGAPQDKVSVLPNTIESRRFALPSPDMRAEARRKLEIPDAAEVLLHFGRDWRLKGGDLFLDAVGRLVSAGRPTFALINQGGAEAKSAAEARGLASRVRIVGLTTEPNELFHAADLVVSSSIGETMPYAVIEALASGLPVVASELAGHDYVADRIDNCVTVPSDPVALADAATRFLDRDPATARREGEAAREWVSEDLDVGRAAERLVDRYEVDLGSRPPAALDEA